MWYGRQVDRSTGRQILQSFEGPRSRVLAPREMFGELGCYGLSSLRRSTRISNKAYPVNTQGIMTLHRLCATHLASTSLFCARGSPDRMVAPNFGSSCAADQ